MQSFGGTEQGGGGGGEGIRVVLQMPVGNFLALGRGDVSVSIPPV